MPPYLKYAYTFKTENFDVIEITNKIYTIFVIEPNIWYSTSKLI